MNGSTQTRFVNGPSLGDGTALLAWLEGHARRADGTRRRFRLPVAARFDDEYRLAIASAVVGARLGTGAAGEIALALDDSALGVALLDTLRTRCPAGAPGCALWLEGYFAPLLDGPAFDVGPVDSSAAGPKRHPFAVLSVGDLVDGGDATPQVEE